MKYIVSWYEKNRMITTNCCKTFKDEEKAQQFLLEQKANPDVRDVVLSATLTEEDYAHINLYADDYPQDVWENYCEACGVSKDSTEITINFPLALVRAD